MQQLVAREAPNSRRDTAGTGTDISRLDASELRRAIDRRELSVAYQPQLDATGTQLTGVEALVRWDHLDHGLILPDNFLGIARDNELMDALGLYMLEQACRDATRWRNLTVAVNICPRHFVKPSFVDDVARILDATGLEAGRLEIEIVESAAFDQPRLATQRIEKLRALGVRSALDDFGVGYSNLSRLAELPVDTVKIDKSLVDGISQARSRAILGAIISLIGRLGMSVTAEGVETQLQRAFLQSCGCHHLQGFLFFPAVGAKQINSLTPV